MSLLAFINKKTFAVTDELEDYIYCDFEIRNIIAILNKKGYETKYSCAGHNDLGCLWPVQKENINNLEDYLAKALEDKALHFIKKEDNYFYHKDEKVATYTYILFARNYQFKNYPQGFIYEIKEEKSYLSKRIDFYEDENHTIKKSDKQISKELEQNYHDLEIWVEKLPTQND